MPEYQMVMDGVPHWGPIEKVAELTAETDWPALRPDDFMYMGRVVAGGRPDVHLYKARDTRRYINLDGQGHAYWYVPTPPDTPIELDTPVEYELVPDLGYAVRWVRS